MEIRPLIAITCSSSAAEQRESSPVLDRLGHTYSSAVWQAGGMPVLLPNTGSEAEAHGVVARLDGLLLSGGYDVDPSLYGQHAVNETVQVDSPRDRFELPLIRAAVSHGVPILAICRGIQVLNVALGGSLWQDLPAQRPSPVTHRQTARRDEATHEVLAEADSRLASIVGSTGIGANSFHHQAVDRLGEGLRVVARAPDGVVEALEGPRGGPFLVAVQYHPEEMVATAEHARRLFAAFVEAARPA